MQSSVVQRCSPFVAACLMIASGCTNELILRAPPVSATYGVTDLEQMAQPPAWEQAGANGTPQSTPDGQQGNRAARQMIYSARFQLSTANVEDALRQLVATVSQLGGYLESRENARIVCRVPASQFGTLVDQIPDWGLVIHQSIKTEDVTRQHRDLRIRLEAAETSRRRVLALMERAEKIEDIIKLEDELRKLTEMVERLQSAHATVGEQIAFSRVEVYFQPHTAVANSDGVIARSPFSWINRVGVERVLGDFGTVPADGPSFVASSAAILPGSLDFDLPEGFLLIQRDRDEIRAITSDEAKLWIRRFAAPRKGNLDFWAGALKRHLVDHRGYKLVAEGRKFGPDRQEGVQLEFETLVSGQPHRYLLRLHIEPGTFAWSSTTVRVLEFVATTPSYRKHAASVGASQPTP